MVRPYPRLDVDRVVVFDAALDRHERAGHHDRPRHVERQASPGTPLVQQARNDHRTLAGAHDPAAGPNVNTQPRILGQAVLADQPGILLDGEVRNQVFAGRPHRGDQMLEPEACRVDHVTVYRWVQRFTPLLADAARFARHSPSDRWFVDETYVKVNGVWRYIYRAVNQHGQVIDVLLSKRRDADAARRFFQRALTTLKVKPTEVVTDAAPVYPRVLDELVPAAWHHVEQYESNRIEADHSHLKHRLRPMRGLRTDRTAQVIVSGLAFPQNLRCGHYELATQPPRPLRIATAFTELAMTI